nr:nuclease-related domain-containing protein [Ornithinimicrobium sediminis]
MVLPIAPVLKGVVAGILFASAFWAPFTAVTISTYSATVGSWGESFTKELLQRERPSWPIVHDVPMQARNVDHVVVSPRAVLAIETKYLGAGSPWPQSRFRDRHLLDARDSARSVRLLLRSADIRTELPVQPVLMLWGPGAPKDVSWTQDGEVHVVTGRGGRQFLEEWNDGPITKEQGLAVTSGLERHQRKRRKYDSEHRGTA